MPLIKVALARIAALMPSSYTLSNLIRGLWGCIDFALQSKNKTQTLEGDFIIKLTQIVFFIGGATTGYIPGGLGIGAAEAFFSSSLSGTAPPPGVGLGSADNPGVCDVAAVSGALRSGPPASPPPVNPCSV